MGRGKSPIILKDFSEKNSNFCDFDKNLKFGFLKQFEKKIP